MGCGSSQAAMDGVVPSTAPVQRPGEFSNYDEEKAPFYTCSVQDVKPIVFANEDIGSREVNPPRTLHEVFLRAKEKKGGKPALRVERPVPALSNGVAPPAAPLEEWKTWSWAEYYADVQRAAKAMLSLGLGERAGVSIFGFNSPEWVMGEMAAIMAGGVSAGIYPTDTKEQVAYKVLHSNAHIALVEDNKKAKTILASIDELPALKTIVVWGETPESEVATRSDSSQVRILTWDGLLKLGDESKNDDELQARMDGQEPGGCCALIYTSGTTGQPKAVMISHDNILFEVRSLFKNLSFVNDENQRIISYLPLSHVAGMMVDIIGPMFITADYDGWCSVNFARNYDLKAGSLGDRLRAVRPTMFLGVPRVWEKIAEKMQAIGAKTKGLKKKIAGWAKKKGLEYSMNLQIGGSGKMPSNYKRANKIVLSKIKLALGLDACKFGFTGAAPISKDTLSYFGSLGIQICEVYGMSENTGAVTISTPTYHRWGSCGWAGSGMELKILLDGKECPLAKDGYNPTEAEQGEVCFRGRNIMMGYMANPALGEEHVKAIQKKTADAIDDHGWLHSGDKGCKDKLGLVYITGRYKELIIGAGGENIAPVPIENLVKSNCPAISNIMMVGDKRKFNVALVTLKAEGATGEFAGNDNLIAPAKNAIAGVTTISEASNNEHYIKMIENAIVATNKLAVNNASKIQKFTILPRDFATETGELTSTLKLKRSVAEKMNIASIDALYASSSTYVAHVPTKAE